MKTRYYIVLMALSVMGMMGCSGGYLDTSPEDQTGKVTVFETTELAELAVNGVAKLMNMEFYYPNRQSPTTVDFNGEGAIKMVYGNWMGNHFVCSNKDGYAALFKGTGYMSNTSSAYCYYPWWYYYMVIGNANTIIVHVGEARGAEADRQRILAQALCTMSELYGQIYDDLDEAVRLFQMSGYERDVADNHLPDVHVAYATYARAALNRQDYETAASMARRAREGFPLMDNAAYVQGFNAVASEWIWSSCNSASETIGQYAFFAKIAYNSRIAEAYSRVKCISRELYGRIPLTDVRRSLFLDPGEMAFNAGTGAAGKELADRARALYPDIYASNPVYAYMQFKFKASDNTGAGDVVHFRSSEMYLIEAEACYFLADEEGARKALVALTQESGRDASYACGKSGKALWEEIKLYRAIELWGEGFDWFDLKRWGDTIDRKSFANGGNFTAKTAFATTPDENNAWTWMIPALETDFWEKETKETKGDK